MFPLLAIWSDWGILFLRVALGLILISHGWPKIKNWKETSKNFDSMGFKPGKFFGPLVAMLEFFGGIGLILGLFTQIFAMAFAIEFIIINIWRMKNKQNFGGGWEFDFLILSAVVLLALIGAGIFALDRIFVGVF